MNDRPLSGRRIAVTRPRHQAASLIEELERLGGEALACPTIRISEREGEGGLEEALANLATYDWIVFTSANGVKVFWEALGAEPLPRELRVAAIGPATARALEARGVSLELVPEEYVAEAVAEVMSSTAGIAGARVLLPRAAGARKVLPERLQEAGAEVDEVALYDSVADEEGIARLREAVRKGEVDMLTFTAASTVRHYVEVAGPEVGEALVAVIGPITAVAARDLGLPVHVEAEEYTVEGLLKAITNYYVKRGGGS